MPENVFILREITNLDAANTISYYKPRQGNSGYVTTLKLKIDINSISPANFPYIPDETPPDVLEKILEQVALDTQFKEVRLLFRKRGSPWIERASLRVFNKEPYYDVSLLRFFSDANTIDCAEDFELGLQIVPGPTNQLTATDKILIWGSSVEEENVSNKIVGEIIAFAGTDIPTGWLICDGRELPIALYPQIAVVLGTTWGSLTNGSGAAGSTHFKIPDLRGRAIVGAGIGAAPLSARNIGQLLGSESHILTANEMPPHTHTQAAHNHAQDAHNHAQAAHAHTSSWFAGANAANSLSPTGGYLTPTANAATTSSVAATNIATTATNQAATAVNAAAGGGATHNNMQPSAVVNYLIFAG